MQSLCWLQPFADAVYGSHPAPWFHRTQATNLVASGLFQ